MLVIKQKEALREIKEDYLLRFRCQVGHAYSAQTLLAEQAEMVEESLWSTLRVLEERSRLLKHVTESVSQIGDQKSVLVEQADEAKKVADFIRNALM